MVESYNSLFASYVSINPEGTVLRVYSQEETEEGLANRVLLEDYEFSIKTIP
jgi:hypothetical protein